MDHHQRSASELASGEPPGATLSLLLIEDDREFSEALSGLLLGVGYAVVCLESATDGLRYLEEGPLPDLIVLELLLPGMNGWQFRVCQKREPKWACIPVIAMSEDMSEKAEAIDASCYLRKPFTDRCFLSAIHRIADDLIQRRENARANELQRILSLGTLVGAIAHEINNPLTSLAGSLELLREQYHKTPGTPIGSATVGRALERASMGVQRISDLMRTVSLFAFADTQRIELLDVQEILESSLQLSFNEIRHCAQLERRYERVPHVTGNIARLTQVFLNVLLNAVHAIRGSSTREHAIQVSTTFEDGLVVASICNTATRFTPEARAYMFDPVAAAEMGRMGVPFGLAISREVVESMGGSIDLEAVHPRGTAFQIRLPIASPPTYPLARSLPSVASAWKRSAIVVIDDDALICELISEVLSDEYDVITFQSSKAALDALGEIMFDLVLCDVMMPELTGAELYELVTQQRPAMKNRFVFITGGVFTEDARALVHRVGLPILFKPWKREHLLETIKSALFSATTSKT